MSKPFKRNVIVRLQTIERFVRVGDAAFCQITLTFVFKYSKPDISISDYGATGLCILVLLLLLHLSRLPT